MSKFYLKKSIRKQNLQQIFLFNMKFNPIVQNYFYDIKNKNILNHSLDFTIFSKMKIGYLCDTNREVDYTHPIHSNPTLVKKPFKFKHEVQLSMTR